jgi:hypothetical protein
MEAQLVFQFRLTWTRFRAQPASAESREAVELLRQAAARLELELNGELLQRMLTNGTATCGRAFGLVLRRRLPAVG